MGALVRLFGVVFVMTAILWVALLALTVFGNFDSASEALAKWSLFIGAVAIASFAATLVSVAMQWSQRLDGSSLATHWREPADDES